MRLRVRDLRDIYLHQRVKVESENLESDEESFYKYLDAVKVQAVVKILKNRVIGEATGDKQDGSVELLYQGKEPFKKGDKVFINITELNEIEYFVDDVVPYSNHKCIVLKTGNS